MVMVRTAKRRLFALDSGLDEWVDAPDRWEREYRTTIACGQCLCPRKDYPFGPIPQFVMKRPKSPICPVMNTGFEVISEALAQHLEPHLRGDVAWSPVFLERDEIIGPLPFRSYVHRPERSIFLRRSPFARHRLCRCGNIIECNVNAKEAIVAYSLDERLAYVTSMGSIVLDGTLVKSLDLAKRFPLLRLWPIPIIDKPLDGDILPGDPGWNGTLVERPIEVPDLNSPLARKWSY